MKTSIDSVTLENLKTLPDAKNKKLKTNTVASKEVLSALNNTFEHLGTSLNIHEACLWVESSQNLIYSKGKSSTRSYKAGDIVLVDLGVDTYGYEFCFEHPCVVLKNDYSKIFMVPCTSKPGKRNKKGKLYPGQMECAAGKGFKENTTVLINEAAFIDKIRIKSVLGVVDKDLYKDIYREVFKTIFEDKDYEINLLDKKLKESQEKYELLEDKLNIIEKENKNLRDELNAEKLVSATEAIEN